LKILKNIIPVIKLYRSVKYLSGYRKEIFKARADGDFEKEREYILQSTDAWGNYVVKTFDIKLTVVGEENLPESGPVLFVANHQGFADVVVTCAALNKFQFAFVAKDSLEMIPIYGKWIKDIRSIYLKRDNPKAALRAVDDGIRLLEQGFSLLIFPEGARSKNDIVSEFKKGSLRLATKPGIPVIPITIDGAYRVFEETGYVNYGAPVRLVIHPAIETKGMEKSVANHLSTEVENIVREGIVHNNK